MSWFAWLLLRLCRLFVSYRLFISYRHADRAETSERLRERLAAHFGARKVFFDAGSLNPGDDFSSRILRAVRRCDYFIVVIGPNWLSCSRIGDSGESRLDDPADFVRREIEAALPIRGKAIPVLLDSTAMPGAGDLPPSLGGLAGIQAHRVLTDPHHFAGDVASLIDFLDRRRWWHGLLILLFATVISSLGVSIASRCRAFTSPASGSPTPGVPASPGDGSPVTPPDSHPPGPVVGVPGGVGSTPHPTPDTQEVSVGGFTVALPVSLPRSKPAYPSPCLVKEAPGAVTGRGFLVLLSRKSDLPAGPWYLQDACELGPRLDLAFRNWNPQGDAEEVCVLLHEHLELAALGDIVGQPVGKAGDTGVVSGQVSAKKVADAVALRSGSVARAVRVVR